MLGSGCEAFYEKGFPACIVRPSHTYETVIPAAIGSWEDFTLIERMRKGKKIIIHGDGSSLWTMTHSRDFAKGFVGLMGNQSSIGHSFHITSEEILTWNQIYEAMAEAALGTAFVPGGVAAAQGRVQAVERPAAAALASGGDGRALSPGTF